MHPLACHQADRSGEPSHGTAARATGPRRGRGRRRSSLHGDGILGADGRGPLSSATASAAIVGRAIGSSGHDAAAGCSACWWRLDAVAPARATSSSISGPGSAAEFNAAAHLFAADRVFSRSAWLQVIVHSRFIVGKCGWT